MRIASVATTFPEHYYAQDELPLALKRQWGDRLGNEGDGPGDDASVRARPRRRRGSSGMLA